MMWAEIHPRPWPGARWLLALAGCVAVGASWAAESRSPQDTVSPLPEESMDELIEYLGSWEEEADWLVVAGETAEPERGEDRSGKDEKEPSR